MALKAILKRRSTLYQATGFPGRNWKFGMTKERYSVINPADSNWKSSGNINSTLTDIASKVTFTKRGPPLPVK